MKGLVSFCLFGTDPKDIYFRGAIKNAEIYAEIRPEWECIFYLSKTVPEWVQEWIEGVGNSRVIRKPGPDNQSATFWRFLAMREAGYDFYLFRDTDSRPGDRELGAVDDWLNTTRANFHVMRDHPRHGVAMLAGMWGVKFRGTYKILGKLPDEIKGDHYQVDQEWLRMFVWPFAKRDVLVHSEYDWNLEPKMNRRAFHIPRTDNDYYVAECRNGDDTLRFPEHRLEVMVNGYKAED